MADDDEEADDGPINIMSWVALAASLALLFFAFASVDGWPLSNGVADTTSKKTEWETDNAVSGFSLPLDYSPFDKKNGEQVISNYSSIEPKVPTRPTAE